MSTGGRMARAPGEEWQAKYPNIAADDGRRVGSILAPEIFTPKFRRLDWVPAPPDSHLLSFAFSDARAMLLLKRDDGSYYYEPAGLPMSRIHIKFKAKGRAPVVQYSYSSREHSLLEVIWKKLVGADHPGKILHAHLEKNPAVRYQQEAASD